VRAAILGTAFLLMGACDDGGGGENGTDDAGDVMDGTVDAGADAAPDGPTLLECFEDSPCPETQYCDVPEGTFDGVCRDGCRIDDENPQSSCGELQICGEGNSCITDPNCDADEHCDPDKYCTEDRECVSGCRVFEDPIDDLCPGTDDDRPQRCNAETHECVPLVVCCRGEACSMELPGDCNLPLRNRTSCFNPNPCVGRCPNGDGDCEEDEYCNEQQQCRRGCRPDDRSPCPGQVCDPETRECVSPPCTGDGDCERNQFCDRSGPDLGECVVGCRIEPDNCPDGSHCNASRQCGEGCIDDQTCIDRNGAGWYCFNGACRAPCVDHTDCEEVEICNPATHHCVPGCRDDDLEPNDDNDGATALDFDEEDSYASDRAEFRACPENSDFFRFTNPTDGGVLLVTIRFRHTDGDLDLHLHPPGGGAPMVADSNTNDEQIRALDAAEGDWFVEVYGRGVEANDYQLLVNLLPPEGCQPDEADEADDVPEGATRFALPGRNDTERVEDRTACIGDVDWFAIPMSPADGLTVQLLILGNDDEAVGDDLDFALYGPGLPGPDDEPAFVPNAAGGGEDGPRFLQFQAPRPNPQIQQGDYYLRVSGVDEGQESRYQLVVTVDRARDLCVDDAGEPNAERAAAYDLMEVEEIVRADVGGGVQLRPGLNLDVEMSLCQGDEDWFRVELERGDEFFASVVRHDADEDGQARGDSIIEIHDANGMVGVPGRSARGLNTARLDEANSGVYWVRVRAAVPETGFNYTLRLNRISGPGDCPRDRYDSGGNNNSADAAALLATEVDHAGLTLCGGTGDVDWFVFEVDAVADVTVTLTFAAANANLDLDIFEEGDEEAINANDRQGHTNDDNEQVELPARLPGRYVARVRSMDEFNARYGLRIDIEPRVFVCEDDPDEPNDHRDQSVLLPLGELERETQWICDRIPSEEDWFALDVQANEERIFAATFTAGDDGDLYIEAYDDDDMLIASTIDIDRINSKQCMVVEPMGGDRLVWFRVVPITVNRVLQDDERLDYTLHVRDSDDCESVLPLAPGAVWPTVPAPE